MEQAKKKPAKKIVEGAKASSTVKKAAEKTEINPCDACKFTLGGGACKSCVNFK